MLLVVYIRKLPRGGKMMKVLVPKGAEKPVDLRIKKIQKTEVEKTDDTAD